MTTIQITLKMFKMIQIMITMTNNNNDNNNFYLEYYSRTLASKLKRYTPKMSDIKK